MFYKTHFNAGGRILRRLAGALVATGLGLGSALASAEADGPDHYRVVGVAPGDVLNIRSEPDPQSVKVGEIPPNGNCIRNLGCRGGLSFQEFTTLSKEAQAARLGENPRWCKVDYQGQVGWVAGRYLTEADCERH